MKIEDAKRFVESLRMRDSSQKRDNTIFLDCSQCYSLEEVKLSMKIENTKETLVKPIVVCHVEDEAKVLFELWRKYTTIEQSVPILSSICHPLIDEFKPVSHPVQPKSMLFISRQRNKYKLLSDTLAELMAPHDTHLEPLTYLVSKYPSTECEMSCNIYEKFGNTIKDICNEKNVYIDDTAKDVRDERVVRFVMNENIDIIFVDKFVWSNEKI